METEFSFEIETGALPEKEECNEETEEGQNAPVDIPPFGNRVELDLVSGPVPFQREWGQIRETFPVDFYAEELTSTGHFYDF